MALTDTIISVIISAIVASIITMIGVWSKWGVDKKKMRLDRRRNFINRCKRAVDRATFEPWIFRESSIYLTLEPHLGEELKRKIKDSPNRNRERFPLEESLKIVNNEIKIRNELLGEISSLERRWRLL